LVDLGLDFTHRLREDELTAMPKIIAQVIGYGLAEEIMNLLALNPYSVPESWKGLMNVTYSFGGLLKDDRL
jgi:hypothetical protein